jgi:PilZ domain
MVENASESRQNMRVSFSWPIRLTCPKETFDSTVIDISLKGILLNQPTHWHLVPTGTTFAAEIFLDGEISIQMSARVVRTFSDRVALEWFDIDDESLGHLRRLLEFNIGDPEKIDQEIKSLVAPTID